ncbi:MAG: DUF4389 domain-containing protein [Candidatus Micrarchaeota archaeon]
MPAAIFLSTAAYYAGRGGGGAGLVKTVQADISVQENASRVELLVRLVYWIPLVIVQAVLGIIAVILWLVNILTVLILGKRVGMDLVKKYWQYYAKMGAYYLLATDERPPIMPE